MTAIIMENFHEPMSYENCRSGPPAEDHSVSSLDHSIESDKLEARQRDELPWFWE